MCNIVISMSDVQCRYLPGSSLHDASTPLCCTSAAYLCSLAELVMIHSRDLSILCVFVLVISSDHCNRS